MVRVFAAITAMLIPLLSLSGSLTDTLKFKQHSGAILIPVKLNGSVSGYFIFDTGATRTCISNVLATHLGFTQTGSSAVFYAGRHEKAVQPVWLLDSIISLGSFKFRSLRVLGMDYSHNHSGTCDSIVGVLGCDVIELFQWEFLFSRGVVLVSPYKMAQRRTDGRSIKFSYGQNPFYQRRPYLSMRLGQQKVKLLLDTGSDAIVSVKGLSHKPKNTSRYQIKFRTSGMAASLLGISSASHSLHGVLRNPTLGGIPFDSLSVHIAASTRYNMLGLGFFKEHDFTLNLRKGILLLHPPAKNSVVREYNYPFGIFLFEDGIKIFWVEEQTEKRGLSINDIITRVNNKDLSEFATGLCYQYSLLRDMMNQNLVKSITVIQKDGIETSYNLHN